MPATTPSAALVPAVPASTNTGRLALAGFLAGYRARRYRARKGRLPGTAGGRAVRHLAFQGGNQDRARRPSPDS